MAATEQRAAELIDRAAKHSLDSYHAFGRCLSGLCRVRQGDSATGLQLVASGIDGLGKSRYEVFVSMFLGEMAHAAATAGARTTGSLPSTRRWRASSATRKIGACPNFCV